MCKRITALLAVSVLMVASAAPASATPVTVGNLLAGPVAPNVTAAGSPALAVGTPANLPLGADIGAAGDPVPPAPFALGANVPFDENVALGGVGPERNDVIAVSNFFGGDFTQARIGDLSADTE